MSATSPRTHPLTTEQQRNLRALNLGFATGLVLLVILAWAVFRVISIGHQAADQRAQAWEAAVAATLPNSELRRVMTVTRAACQRPYQSAKPFRGFELGTSRALAGHLAKIKERERVCLDAIPDARAHNLYPPR